LSRFSKYCIYTIRQSDWLDERYQVNRAGTVTEGKSWKTGQELFNAAQADGETMPVVFAAAESITGLIYWAKLTSIAIKESGTGAETTYTFTDLTPIGPGHDLSELTLRESRRPLSDNYIRPYAICDTPIWVRWSAA